jgi:hypothetical protein
LSPRLPALYFFPSMMPRTKVIIVLYLEREAFQWQQ